MFKMWQNLAIFGGRPISAAVEALLPKVVNRRSSLLPIVVFVVAAAVSVITSSEVQSKMIFMGHQILSCHVPVVRSFFIL
jgi:hypothetical protein